MERFEPEISFELPSNMNFETFSGFPLPVPNSNRTITAEIATENFLRKLSEKIGRGFSGSSSMARNQVILNGSDYPVEDWIRQVEYDKFMNEIWIGIVLTLIVISLVFCICSCFLYHQFRQWKSSYHRNMHQNNDIESVKLNLEEDDLPNYTLVSGLPSYDAALQQLQNSTENCPLMYPSVFKIFSTNEKQNSHNTISMDVDASVSNDALSAKNSIPSYEEAIADISDTKNVTLSC